MLSYARNYIKNFFNNKETLLGAAPLEKGSTETAENTPASQDFTTQIHFDPKDFLNPRVCCGENFFPNILRDLRANEDLIKNPAVLKTVISHISDILKENRKNAILFF